MSLVTQAFVFERFGPRLNVEQLAAFLCVTKTTLYNQITAGTCPVKTYLDGKSRFADYRDVAAHLDTCREKAT